MSSIWLLMGLCVLAYVGSFLVGKRAGGGLPAGTEYVLLGFLLGPSALGLVERSMLVAFEPAAQAALGWFAFVLGLQYGVNEGQRVRATRLAGSWLAFAFTAACIGGAVYGCLTLFACRAVTHQGIGAFCAGIDGGGLDRRDRLLLAGGVAVSTAETTRYAVRWVVARGRAKGPVTDLAGDLAESDDLAPLLAVAALFAFAPERDLALAAGVGWPWLVLTLGLGALLGGMSAVLLGQTFRVAEAWSVMLGMSMLAIGTASRLGLASMSAMFVMGAAISVLSRHRAELVAMIGPTERPVMLPALLLAGANIDFTSAKWFAWLLPVAILARLAAKVLVGFGVLAVVPRVRKAGPLLGLGMSSAGALSMSLGLAFALRFPGLIGAAVLASAGIATVVGEIIGPAVLRACLGRAGELPEDESAPASTPPSTDGVPPRSADAEEHGRGDGGELDTEEAS